MFWKKEPKMDPIEEEKDRLAREWTDPVITPEKRKELIDRYVELDQHQLEVEKVKKDGKIDAKTLLSSGVTVGLALLTLNFERFDVLRSKVSNLWLRRKQ